MVKWIVSRAWMLLVILLAGVIVTSAGCVNVDAPKDVSVDVPDYYHRHERKDEYKREARHDRHEPQKDRRYEKLEKDEAYDIAKDLARDEGVVHLDRFEIHDKKINDVFWVLFESDGRGGRGDRRGWREHFAVRVAREHGGKTRATLYKGGRREDYSRDMDKKKVKKDEAYKYAESMARSCGAQPRHYEIHDKKIDDNYWVLFESKNPGRSRGWQDHFAVRVSKYGIGEMYK